VSKVNRAFILCALYALACGAALVAPARAEGSFPRTAGYLIGDPRNFEDAAYRSRIAKLDIAILSTWPGWETSHGITVEEVVKRIKAINPETKIFMYFLPESLRYPVNPSYTDLGAKLDSQRWWLYTSGSGPTKVLSDFGKDTYILNLTAFTPQDSGGKRLNQWLPQYAFDKFGKPSPSLDGLFTDNIFWKPRRNGDWNRDGTIDDQNSATVQRWYREGYRTYLNGLKQLMPGKMQIANIADWGKAEAVLTEYDQLLQGGIMEAIIGQSYSVEGWAGWAGMLAHYRKSMAALAAPKLGIFHQFGVPSDFQSFRYGLATALLDDGYYAFTDTADGYSGVEWFDELDVNLGVTVSIPPRTAWQSGVWRRDFDKGIALVNPKGNGTREVTLERDYRKLTGTQDRVINNGEVVRKVTLRDRDGIILLRMPRRPRSPNSVSIIPPG
jgi:hypothetical protein